MANCSSCNGSCGRGSCTRVGALNTLCRTGCRFPYYTGPCPPAPCVNSCGSACPASRCCRCTNAQVIDLNDCHDCGCDACHGCNTCDSCHSCAACHGCGCSACDSCGGCNDCDCGDCDSARNCSGCGYSGYSMPHCSGCNHARHAVFSAGGPVNLSAGSAVNFEACDADSHYFTTSYGSILIRRPGLYYAAVTIDIPKNTGVDTVMRLELDSRSIAAAEIAVAAGCDGTTSNFAGHAVFHANAGSLLKLCSLREMDVDCGTAQPVFTVTLFRID